MHINSLLLLLQLFNICLHHEQLLDKVLNKPTAKKLKEDVWNHILKILPKHLEQLKGNDNNNMDVFSVVADSVLKNCEQLTEIEVVLCVHLYCYGINE